MAVRFGSQTALFCLAILFYTSLAQLTFNVTLPNGPRVTKFSGGEFFDVDGDGYKDLLLAGSEQSSDLSIWFGSSASTWTSEGAKLSLGTNSNLANQIPYELVDSNRDGVADVLTGKTDDVPTMWLSYGERSYKRIPYPLPSRALSISSCDLNADGYNDLIFLFNSGVVMIRENIFAFGLFHSQNVTFSIPADTGYTSPYPNKLVCIDSTSSSAAFALVCGDNWCAPLSLPGGTMGSKLNVTEPNQPLQFVSQPYRNEDGSATVLVQGGQSIGILRFTSSAIVTSTLHSNVSSGVPSGFTEVFASGTSVSWALINETSFACSFWTSSGSYVFAVSNNLASVDVLFAETSTKYLSISPKTSGYASEPEILVSRTNSSTNQTEILSTGLARFPVVTPSRTWYRTGSAATITIRGSNFGSSLSDIAVQWLATGCTGSIASGGCPAGVLSGAQFTCTFPSYTGSCDILVRVSVTYSDSQKNRTTSWRHIGASSQSRLLPIEPPVRKYISGGVSRVKIDVPVADTPTAWPGAIGALLWSVAGDSCSGTITDLCATTYQINRYGFSCDFDINVIFPATGLVSNASQGCPMSLSIRTAGGAILGPAIMGYITQPLLIDDYTPKAARFGSVTVNVTLQSNFSRVLTSNGGLALNGVFQRANLPSIVSANTIRTSFYFSSGNASIQLTTADFLETPTLTVVSTAPTITTRSGNVPINITFSLQGTALPTQQDGSTIQLSSPTSTACNDTVSNAIISIERYALSGTRLDVKFTTGAAAEGCQVVLTLIDSEGFASQPSSIGTFKIIIPPTITSVSTYESAVSLSPTPVSFQIFGSGLPISSDEYTVDIQLSGTYCAVSNSSVSAVVLSTSETQMQLSFPSIISNADSCEIFARIGLYRQNSTVSRVGRLVGMPVLSSVPALRFLTLSNASSVNVSLPISGSFLPIDPQEPFSVSISSGASQCPAPSIQNCSLSTGSSLSCVVSFSNVSDVLSLYDCVFNATVRRHSNGPISAPAPVLRTTFRPSFVQSTFELLPNQANNITLTGSFFPRENESFSVLASSSQCNSTFSCSNASIIVPGISLVCLLQPIPSGCGEISVVIFRGDVASESIVIGYAPDAPSSQSLDPLPGGVVATTAQIGGLQPQEVAAIVIGAILAVILIVFTVLIFLIRTKQPMAKTPRASMPNSPRTEVEMINSPRPVVSPRRPLPELSESSSMSSTSLSSLGWSKDEKQKKKDSPPAEVNEKSGSDSDSDSSQL